MSDRDHATPALPEFITKLPAEYVAVAKNIYEGRFSNKDQEIAGKLLIRVLSDLWNEVNPDGVDAGPTLYDEAEDEQEADSESEVQADASDGAGVEAEAEAGDSSGDSEGADESSDGQSDAAVADGADDDAAGEGVTEAPDPTERSRFPSTSEEVAEQGRPTQYPGTVQGARTAADERGNVFGD